jgi:hypothetical protein
VEQEIDLLDGLSFPDLQARYEQLYSLRPPKRIGRKLLILAIAYEMQRKAFGVRVDRVHARALKAVEHSASKAPPSPRRSLSSGGRLVREWRGKTYEVYVAEDGCYLDGKRHASLSAVAFAITGVKRNGPAFFGLRSSRVSS